MHAKTESKPRHRAVLTIGFLAATVAVLAAYTSPATGYELSIYGSTPLPFWVGVAVGLATALYVGVAASEWQRTTDGALGLATYCVVAVIALPLLRSYHFYGGGDSLTHLGWAREIRAGVIDPGELLYPAIHLLSVFFGELAPLDLTYALKFLPLLVFPLLFVIGTALCVEFITENRWGAIVGVFSALLFIPVNKVSIHFMSHPSSQTVLFLPIVLYFMLRFVTDDKPGFALTTPAGAAFLITGAGLVFLHPQETMTFVAMLVVVAVLQAVVRRFSSSRLGESPAVSAIADHRPIYLHTLVIGGAFLAWSSQFARVRNTISGVVESLLTGSTTVLEQETAERGASLVQLGGSFEELFLKLFAVATVFCLLAGVLFLANVTGRLDRTKSRRNALISYVGFALIAPSTVFVLTFLAPVGDHYFRFLGFILALVTILGAVGVTELVGTLETRAGARTGRFSRSHLLTTIAVVFAVLLVVQVAAVHMSPYLFLVNPQVTEAEMNGFDVAFEYHDGETPLVGLRTGPRRFVDAHFGSHTAANELVVPGARESVPEDVFGNNETTHYDGDRYLVIRQSNWDREVGLYDGLRYSADGFTTVESNAGINRVQHNGEFRLYRIRSAE